MYEIHTYIQLLWIKCWSLYQRGQILHTVIAEKKAFQGNSWAYTKAKHVLKAAMARS